MEMPTPQYGKNAIVWGMHLLSEALGQEASRLRISSSRRLPKE
jgi:hypothetical protein